MCVGVCECVCFVFFLIRLHALFLLLLLPPGPACLSLCSCLTYLSPLLSLLFDPLSAKLPSLVSYEEFAPFSPFLFFLNWHAEDKTTLLALFHEHEHKTRPIPSEKEGSERTGKGEKKRKKRQILVTLKEHMDSRPPQQVQVDQ